MTKLVIEISEDGTVKADMLEHPGDDCLNTLLALLPEEATVVNKGSKPRSPQLVKRKSDIKLGGE
jgi:hypothetical protein